MKIKYAAIIFSSVLMLSLSSCSFLFKNNSATSNNSSTSSKKEFVGIKVEDNNVYTIGQKYLKDGELTYFNVYSDGSKEQIEVKYFSRSFISDPDGQDFSLNDTFKKAGLYPLNVEGNKDGVQFNETININVVSGYDVGAKATKIENISNSAVYENGDLFFDKANITFDVTWENLGLEHVKYNKDMSQYSLFLYEVDKPSINCLNEPLDTSKIYSLKVSIGSVFGEVRLDFIGGDSFVKPEKLSILASDIDNEFAPALGEVKVLIVPIELEKGTISNALTWTDELLEQTNTYFFGERKDTPNEWNSFKTYYETASFNQLNVSGMMTEVYYETNYTLKMDAVAQSYYKLMQVMANAINYLQDAHPEVNWSEYDVNDDGCIDSVHFISNAPQLPNTNLWPHMAKTGDIGTINRPHANVYSMSSLGHMGDARTQIHEQGHMFGLADYYDYTYSGRDYVGQADMQSYNYFDWNSFSKMSVGWITPYVYTGKLDVATITIGSASKTGDCLIVPADYSTWNGSAYDEYFLIELFTPDGNNELDWQTWSEHSNLGEYGIRMYHVDARLWGYNSGRFEFGSIVNSIDDSSYEMIQFANNNSYDSSDYATQSPKNHTDLKLLTLLQKDASNSFGKPYGNKSLSSNDLFQTGDTFTFDKFAHYLRKKGTTPTVTNKGEEFPYQIKFNEVSKDSATITISRIA